MVTREKQELAPGQDPEGPPAPAGFPSFLLALFDEVNVKILQGTTEDYLSVKDIAKAGRAADSGVLSTGQGLA